MALNAGAALMVCGMAATVADGVEQARDLMRSGRAERVLQRYIESSVRLAKVAV